MRHERVSTISVAAVVALIAVAGVSSAGEAKPSESDGRQVAENLIKANSHGLLKLVKFEKTNGVDQAVPGGPRVYSLEFKCAVELLADACWGIDGGMQPVFGAAAAPSASKNFNWADYSKGLSCMGFKLRGNKGDVQEAEGQFYFEMTEKGWRGSDRNIYSGASATKQSGESAPDRATAPTTNSAASVPAGSRLPDSACQIPPCWK